MAVLLLSISSARGVLAEEEQVTVPLEDNYGEVGIPVKVQGNFAVITLLNPDGRKLKVVMDDDDSGKVPITVKDPNGPPQKSMISLQDWPQVGTVMPFSPEWPVGGVVTFTIKDWNGKTSMSLVVQQDWPQGSLEVTLT